MSEQKYKENLNINLVKQIQQDFPLSIIGGSTALFLHGVRLKRWLTKDKDGKGSDIDIIVPYYVKFDKLSNGNQFIDSEAEYPSASDFDERLEISGVKVDVCVCPKTKYQYIEYEGFSYKVNTLKEIWEAKIRYGTKKHIQDLKDAMIVNKQQAVEIPVLKTSSAKDDLPW
jgi:hypothetical protein